jgi:hypothetical protein
MTTAFILLLLQSGDVSAHAGETHAEHGTSIGWAGEIGVILVFGLCAWLVLRDHWSSTAESNDVSDRD